MLSTTVERHPESMANNQDKQYSIVSLLDRSVSFLCLFLARLRATRLGDDHRSMGTVQNRRFPGLTTIVNQTQSLGVGLLDLDRSVSF